MEINCHYEIPVQNSISNRQNLLSGQKLFETVEHGLVSHELSSHRILRSHLLCHQSELVDIYNHRFPILSSCI